MFRVTDQFFLVCHPCIQLLTAIQLRPVPCCLPPRWMVEELINESKDLEDEQDKVGGAGVRPTGCLGSTWAAVCSMCCSAQGQGNGVRSMVRVLRG